MARIWISCYIDETLGLVRLDLFSFTYEVLKLAVAKKLSLTDDKRPKITLSSVLSVTFFLFDWRLCLDIISPLDLSNFTYEALKPVNCGISENV